MPFLLSRALSELSQHRHKLVVELDESGRSEVVYVDRAQPGDDSRDLLGFFLLGFAGSDLENLEEQLDVLATVFPEQANLTLNTVGELVEELKVSHQSVLKCEQCLDFQLCIRVFLQADVVEQAVDEFCGFIELTDVVGRQRSVYDVDDVLGNIVHIHFIVEEDAFVRSEEHTSELQSRENLV